jgi:Spy/CpxP family protein refolding chaperone
MHTRALLLAAALVTGLTGQAGAQAPFPHEDLGGLFEDIAGQFRALGERFRGYLGGPASGRERPLISIMLSHREDLGLSPAQVQALERLRGEFQKVAIRREADIRVAEMDVASLLEAEPVDLAKVEARVRESGQLRTDLRVARIRVMEEGRSQLTPEQRGKLARLLAEPPRPSSRRDRHPAPVLSSPRPDR